MLPNGWKKKKLRSIGVCLIGLTYSPNQVVDEGGLLVLRSSNIKDGQLTFTDNVYVNAEVDNRLIVEAGDLLICVRNGSRDLIGKSALIDERAAGSTFGAFMSVFRSPYSSYLYQLFHSEEYRRQVRANLGATINQITSGALNEFEFVFPPASEMSAIVQVLETWDRAIVKTGQILANSRRQLQALIGITLHLPSANLDASASTDSGGFPASVQPGIPTLPPAPRDWRRIQLRDHLLEVRRPVALVDDETYTLVTVKRSRGGVQLREILRGSEVKTPTQFIVRTGDFLISKRQIVHGACGIVPPELDGAVVSNEYAVLNSDGEIDLRFLRYLSETRYFQQTCFHSSIGVHIEKMIFKTDHWLNWSFNIPPLAEQRRIVKILDAAGQELVALGRQIDSLKQEKAALMSQLLTGKRRVKLPDTETAAQA